jgi:hypothetical protein
MPEAADILARLDVLMAELAELRAAVVASLPAEACALAIRDKVGSAAAPAARCRNRRRGSFIERSGLTPP